MGSAADFYQTLTGTCFTLLGLWVGVMQFGHGDWRRDPRRLPSFRPCRSAAS